jgi:hypothetical protein
MSLRFKHFPNQGRSCMHGPSFSPRAYSYVKREALKTCYALRRALLCRGNVRGGLRLNKGFHFTEDGEK